MEESILGATVGGVTGGCVVIVMAVIVISVLLVSSLDRSYITDNQISYLNFITVVEKESF